MLKIQDQSDSKKYEPHLLLRSLLDSERYGERIFFGMMCVFFFFIWKRLVYQKYCFDHQF